MKGNNKHSDMSKMLLRWVPMDVSCANKECVQVSSYNCPFGNLKYIVHLKCRLFLALINVTTLTVIEAVENERWLYHFLEYSTDTVMHTLTALITVHNTSTISCNLCICNSAPQLLGQWLLQEIQADWDIRAVNQGSFTTKLLPRDNKQLLKLTAWSSAPKF